MKSYVYQIHYNAETKQKLLPGFLPLDNSSNERPDWFEFWVILKFLRNNTLEDDAWYGFVSPKFYEKTGFSSDFVLKVLTKYGNSANVALFSPAWDQLAYFLNPFEQGEVWHPGLVQLSQRFINTTELDLDLSHMVCDTSSAVFSNYCVAKKSFWSKWQKLAEQFFDWVESNSIYSLKTSYGSPQHQFPMKTFIQERLANVILGTNDFTVIAPDQSLTGSIFTRLFSSDCYTRRLLQTCDLMKSLHRKTRDEMYLDMYWNIRREVRFTAP